MGVGDIAWAIQNGRNFPVIGKEPKIRAIRNALKLWLVSDYVAMTAGQKLDNRFMQVSRLWDMPEVWYPGAATDSGQRRQNE